MARERSAARMDVLIVLDIEQISSSRQPGGSLHFSTQFTFFVKHSQPRTFLYISGKIVSERAFKFGSANLGLLEDLQIWWENTS
jgi:hypothetical protein